MKLVSVSSLAVIQNKGGTFCITSSGQRLVMKLVIYFEKLYTEERQCATRSDFSFTFWDVREKRIKGRNTKYNKKLIPYHAYADFCIAMMSINLRTFVHATWPQDP